MRRLALLLTFAAAPAAADPFDWTLAADTGGIWTVELGDAPTGRLRALIGRNPGGPHDRYSVSLLVDDRERLALLDEMADALPIVRRQDGRIVVRLAHWPAGADRAAESERCFAWDAGARTLRAASCP